MSTNHKIDTILYVIKEMILAKETFNQDKLLDYSKTSSKIYYNI
jgi:hypothetical protein